MYVDTYSVILTEKLVKTKKKDLKQYLAIMKKRDFILAHPEHSYKDLHYSMKGVKRVHLGHLVLTFIIDHDNKTVSFEDFDHHDKIYK